MTRQRLVARGEVPLAGITSRQLPESRSGPTVDILVGALSAAGPMRGHCPEGGL
jgi:hypothetical protein